MTQFQVPTKQTGKAVVNKLVNVWVNSHNVQVEQGKTLLDAIKKAGAHVPTLCYSPAFKPRGVCRMCLVDVGSSKPVPACYTPVFEGAKISTDSKELKEFRRHDLELLLSRHPNECMRCEAAGNCKLQSLVQEDQVQDIWPKSIRGSLIHPEHHLVDHTSPAIDRDMAKCIECGLCIDACNDQKMNVIGFAERGKAMVPVTVFDKPLSETNCISCGQCTVRCPVGALVERPDWHRVLDVLNTKRRVTVVQTAPATRVAIGEEFGLEPGSISTGKLVNALRELGFDYVTDTNFAADLTIMEEANELVERVQGKREGPLPMFTSCCPGWVNYVELSRPDLIPHLSTTKSPQQMHAAITKHGPFLKILGEKFTSGQEEPFVVSVMPCTAKKDEAVRPNHRGDVDAVITTRELAKMIRHRKIPFASLSSDGDYDSALGESTGAAAIFGASGGVMEAALRTATHILGFQDAPIEFEQVRGVSANVKSATVPGIGSVAVVNSIAAAVDFLSNDEWRQKYVMIEVMACRGGCLGGGGEPKSDDPDILRKRMEGIYKIDAAHSKRKSHENKEVQQLYASFLDHPLSEKAEELLHTSYAARRSERDVLARFLAAVDFRDGNAAAALFSEYGEWKTNSPLFGTVIGRKNIASLINSRLPSNPIRSDGRGISRHDLVSRTSGLEVLSPNQEKVHFSVSLDSHSGLISTLERILK